MNWPFTEQSGWMPTPTTPCSYLIWKTTEIQLSIWCTKTMTSFTDLNPNLKNWQKPITILQDPKMISTLGLILPVSLTGEKKLFLSTDTLLMTSSAENVLKTFSEDEQQQKSKISLTPPTQKKKEKNKIHILLKKIFF